MDGASDAHALELENAQLQEMIQQLSNENNKLRSQCDETMQMLSDMKRVQDENKELKQQLVSRENENDNLKKRLDIYLQTRDELSGRAESNRAAMERSHQFQMNELSQQMSQLRQTSQQEVSELKALIRGKDDEIAQKATECTTANNQLGKLLNCAGNYFQTEFSTPNALLQFLMHPSSDSSSASSSEPIIIPDERATRKLKKWKHKYEEEAAARKQCEMELMQLRQSADTEAIMQVEKINEFQDYRRKQMLEMKKLKLSHEQELCEIQEQLKPQKKFKSMSTQTAPLKQDDSMVNSLNRDKELLEGQLNEKNEVMGHLTQKIAGLKAQLENNEEAKEKMRRRVKKEQARAELIEQEFTEIQEVVASMEQDVLSMRDKLHKSEEENRKLKTKIEMGLTDLSTERANVVKLQDANKILEELTGAQRKEMAMLTKQREKLATLVQKQSECLRMFDAEMQILQYRKGDNSTGRESSREREAEEHIEWDFGNCPEDMKLILRQVTDNDGFPISTRIKHAFGVVGKWINNLNNAYDTDIKKVQCELDQSNRTLTGFASSLVAILDRNSLTCDEIVDAVAELQKEKLTIEQKMNMYEVQHRVVFDQETYDELTSAIEDAQQKLKKANAKAKHRKSELHDCKHAFLAYQRQTNDERDNLKQMNARTREEIEKIQAEVDSLQKRNEVLYNELEAAKKAHIAEYNEAQAEFDARMYEEIHDHELAQAKSASEIRELSEKVLTLEAKLSKAIQSSQQWQERLSKSTDEEMNLRRQLEELEMSKDQAIMNIEKIMQKKISETDSKHEEQITQLKEKIAEAQELNTKLAEVITKHEHKIKHLSSQNSQLVFALKKADTKIQSQTDAIERESKLAEFRMRTQRMAAETDFSMKIEQMKHEWDMEKRDMFGYMASQFKSCCDASTPIDESSFKGVVDRVKHELDRRQRQEESIRKALRAKPGESTADALTDLIMMTHPRLRA